MTPSCRLVRRRLWGDERHAEMCCMERRMRRRKETLQHKHGQKDEGKGGGVGKGQTCKARGKRAKYLFVHKVSLHSNEVLHDVFSKQTQPSSTHAELPEGDVIPARALSAQGWPVSHEGLPASRRATGRGREGDVPWGHQAAPPLIQELAGWVFLCQGEMEGVGALLQLCLLLGHPGVRQLQDTQVYLG